MTTKWVGGEIWLQTVAPTKKGGDVYWLYIPSGAGVVVTD